jgi:circadian clock protein KaiB
MSQAHPDQLRSGKIPRGHYRLRLFMVGHGPNSQQALSNLRSICQEHLPGRYTIETVDVAKDFQAAVRDNILVTPALILVAPRPRVVILGNLSDRAKVLLALRLPAGGDS